MTDPQVTVLMPVFNSREYLPAAVESILCQSFADFEFLIINDGSTEPIADVLDDFKDDRIRLVDQENMGLTRSLNKGLRLAKGRYIARMDADDLSLPGRLEAQVYEMDTDPRLDLVGTFFDVINHRGDLIERKELVTDPIYRLWRLQFHNNYGHGSVMLRKEAIFNVGLYDETLAYAQDFDLWSRLSMKDNTKIIPEALYQYRMVETGDQSSVRNYHEQLAIAVRTSNRSLMQCNGSLTEDDCIEVRAIYWKFQRGGVSYHGLSLVTDTVEGFCRRYELDPIERSRLLERVAHDALHEMEKSSRIGPDERAPIKASFLRLVPQE
jgi:glycosyltransferase involved in cell wall biosynthesis